MAHKFIFIMCPPFQGSTLLYRLIDSSPNVSTLLGKSPWAGEAQYIYKDIDPNYWDNRNNKDYDLDMDMVWDVCSSNWDMSKPVLCEKSPQHIYRADKIYDYFSKKGEVYFMTQIRDPYHTNYSKPWIENPPLKWDRHAEQIKHIEDKYSDIIVKSTYETLCDDFYGTADRILEKFPFLGSLNPDSIVNGTGEGRFGKLKKVSVIHNVDGNNEYFKDNHYYLDHFNYKNNR